MFEKTVRVYIEIPCAHGRGENCIEFSHSFQLSATVGNDEDIGEVRKALLTQLEERVRRFEAAHYGAQTEVADAQNRT